MRAEREEKVGYFTSLEDRSAYDLRTLIKHVTANSGESI